LESLLNHIDGVLRWGIDGRLHLKLMRDDEDTDLMQVVDESIMLDDFGLERKSWLDTQNEIKVQYPLLVVGDCELCLSDDTDAPVLTLVGQNGSVGNYEITEGCPPFFIYIRLWNPNPGWGEWIFNRTVYSREFNGLVSHVGCGFEDIDREMKVTDTWGRDSNSVDIKIKSITPLVWDGDKAVGVGAGSVEISWTGGAPPFTLQVFDPLLSFDTQYYSQFIETGLQSATIYFSGQVCGRPGIAIRDACNQGVNGRLIGGGALVFDDDSTPDTINPGGNISLFVQGGVGPYTWSITDGFGHSLGSETTSGVSNTLSCVGGICGVDYSSSVEIEVEDGCENTVSFEIRNTGGGWVQMGSPHHSQTTCGSTSLCNPTCFRCYTVGTERWCASPVTRGSRQGAAPAPCNCVRDGSNWTAWGPGSSPFPPIGAREMWGILHDGDPLGCGGNCGNCSTDTAGLDLYRAYYDKWTC
jgi:hypothetical protein